MVDQPPINQSIYSIQQSAGHPADSKFIRGSVGCEKDIRLSAGKAKVSELTKGLDATGF